MTCREAFVKMIKKEENFFDPCRQSLKQHWSGKNGGFANNMTQQRWRDFEKGWDAAPKEGEEG